jgi:hypothetical protein
MPSPIDSAPETHAAPLVCLAPNLWEDFVEHLDPQSACELVGLEHFPHWLASAANMLLLAQYLAARHGPGLTIRQALTAELKAGPHPPSGSENTAWWKAIEPHVQEWEAMVRAFMQSRGALRGEDDDRED